mgnify:CR=1 FL=1
MERYTNPDCKPEMEELMKDCPRSRSGAECWLRLCDIEDILGDEYDLDELREMVQTKREGRCVVLPKDGMVYYIEEAGGEKWIGNKPIQQVVLRCGFGMALLEFSLFDKGKYFSRAEAEAALWREQE